MTENTSKSDDDRDIRVPAVDHLRIFFAVAGLRMTALMARIPARYTSIPARRGVAFALLLTGSAMLVWQVFGPDAPTDVAQGLAEVTDAARTAAQDTLASDMMPTLPSDPVLVAALPTPPAPKVAAVRETLATTATGPCMVSIEVMPLAAATVAVDINAPCDPRRRVDIIQNDLQIAVALDAEGRASLDLPALSRAPAIAVLVTDRDPVTVQTDSVDFEKYQRAVVYWQGDAAFELHAFEGDAGYGDEGHVGPSRPRTIAHALSGNGGFMTTLGDVALSDARMAIVYTVSAETPVDLSIEAPVTAANCEQTVFGGSIRVGPNAPAITEEITMTIPSCEGIGDYVLLGDMMRPTVVAAH
ncbi:MAG: hypothetical protein WBA67_18240 [Jannaschia sp.]